VFDHPGIRVMAASAEHAFAMKAFAGRSRDEDDLRTVEAALELCERSSPGRCALPPMRCRRYGCIVRSVRRTSI
jgi:hypothetical protein